MTSEIQLCHVRKNIKKLEILQQARNTFSREKQHLGKCDLIAMYSAAGKKNFFSKNRERAMFNSHIFASRDGVCSRMEKRIDDGNCVSLFKTPTGIRDPKRSHSRLACSVGVDLALGSYSAGNALVCQTLLGNPLGDEEKDDFNFISFQFKIGVTKENKIILIPHNVITDGKTAEKESREDLANALSSIVSLHTLTRKLDRSDGDGDECNDIFSGESIFKFVEFPDPAIVFASAYFAESKPFLEKAFIFKICRLLVAKKKIKRVYPSLESEDYEELGIDNFTKIVFKLVDPTDDGFFMGIKGQKSLSLEKSLSSQQKNCEPLSYKSHDIVVDHTSAQYFRARSLQCNRCEKHFEVGRATLASCGIIGDGFFDYTDLEGFQCTECHLKGNFTSNDLEKTLLEKKKMRSKEV